MDDDKAIILDACRDFLSRIPLNLNYLSPGELDKALKADPQALFVLDNRTPEAFAQGHIAGATNIWLKDTLTDENLARLPRDKTIVVCCWVGHTASQLLTVLQLLGFRAVGLKYGMGESAIPGEARNGWLDCHLPIERSDT